MAATTTETAASQQLLGAYRQKRLQISGQVLAAVAATWAQLHANKQATIAAVVQLVGAGQSTIVQLVDAYMAQQQIAAIGHGAPQIIDPAKYTISALRGVTAASVYARPFGAYGAFLAQGVDEVRAVEAAQASVTKLAQTDMQLAQTHAARDWMAGNEFVVGYRRVLNPPSCSLCTLAADRTYRKADLMPIHEHCDCTVEPLWGTEPVASVGTAVRVEHDPEIGPRLMADNWSNVGPRLIEKPV